MNFNVFDILVVACGLYMAYCAIMMKTQGKVNSGVVMSRNFDESMLKDKEGFIGFVWSKLLAVGIMCAASGAFNLIYTYFARNSSAYVIVEVVVNTLFFILLIVYAVTVTRAQKRFMK